MEDRTLLGTVETVIKGGIATIIFHHPDHNALPGRLLAMLIDAIEAVGANDSVQVVVLKSEGERTFCAGASFDELMSIQDFETGKQFFMGFARVINAMRKCPKLIIGRVQGKAVGGGVGLAAATDYCMATKYASVKLSELAIGIGPFVVGPAVARKMGVSDMSLLAINATEWRTAEWAKQKGLFSEVFETTEQLDAYIEHLGEKLAKSNPAAMQELKRIFWEDCAHWDQLLEERAAISGQLVLSDFTRKAIDRFKQKS
ncbi:MAG: enoyl-CoA hydratase [Saprospiraceae bacterium]|nr:MAG: enoyl-CoA hydratase [Saprospiraceae bacterium]